MVQSVTSAVYRLLSLSWLTGPIFDKELRVASRRKRNYVLRGFYLVVLSLVLFIFLLDDWYSGYQSIAYQVTRISQMGLYITGTMVLVQFFASQILSIVLLSNSISDEIFHKTLGVLMSTPINSMQIVGGKLLSKLLQIFLLIGVTLPILAMVRVFGGVPWNYLLMSFCVTLTAVLFSAMLSLNLSIYHKHAYVVIILEVLLLLLLFLVLPLFVGWIASVHYHIREDLLLKWMMVLDPFVVMFLSAFELFEPGQMPISTTIWWWNCVFMLGCTLLLYLRAVVVVRRKALLQACGQTTGRVRKKDDEATSASEEKIRHVKGNPVVWRELRRSMFEMGWIKTLILFSCVIGVLGFSYYIFKCENALKYSEPYIIYGIIFLFLGVFFTTVFSATTITSEKSSQSWPILLCTMLSDWEILRGKSIGVFRRSLPIWGLLVLHVLVFTLFVGYIHPIAIFQVLLIIIPVIFFLTASGIMFSALLKSTTSAVIANLIFAASVWAGIPLFIGILSGLSHGDDGFIKLVLSVNPFFQMGMLMEATSGEHSAMLLMSKLRYDWFGDKQDVFVTTIWFILIGLLYSGFALIMWTAAKRMIREKIF